MACSQSEKVPSSPDCLGLAVVLSGLSPIQEIYHWKYVLRYASAFGSSAWRFTSIVFHFLKEVELSHGRLKRSDSLSFSANVPTFMLHYSSFLLKKIVLNLLHWSHTSRDPGIRLLLNLVPGSSSSLFFDPLCQMYWGLFTDTVCSGNFAVNCEKRK